MAEIAARLAGVAVGLGVADRLGVADGVAAAAEVVSAVDVGLVSAPVDGVCRGRMVAVSAFGQNSSVATTPPTSRAMTATSSGTSARDRRGFALRACATGSPNQFVQTGTTYLTFQ
jgi:hypothetical protein